MNTIGDLRESSVAKELVEHTLQEFGQIDCLVNAAGILVNGTVLETSVTEYDKQFDVNVRRYLTICLQIASCEFIKFSSTLKSIKALGILLLVPIQMSGLLALSN